MTPSQVTQRNLYKGASLRCWVVVRFVAPDGSVHARELVADTGCPCAVILGTGDMALLSHNSTGSLQTNFGLLVGGWLELLMPELGLAQGILSYASDVVMQMVQHDTPDFMGLVGLPFLKLLEYGGDGTSFWVSKPSGGP